MVFKTILTPNSTLVNKDYPEGYEKFIHDNGIKHYVFDMVGTKKEAIPLSTMAAILRLVRDQRHYPMLIHCNHGRVSWCYGTLVPSSRLHVADHVPQHRTGCVVAVARLMAGWDRAAILDEYKKYAEPKIRECDIEYITQFDLTQLSGALAGDTKLRKMGNFVRETIASFFVLVVWLFTGEIWSRHNARPAEKGPAEKGPAEKCGN